MKNGICKHFTDAILVVFICFSSLLTAKDEPTIHSDYSNSILELLNTPNTTPSEELLSAPTGTLSYSVGGITVSSVKEGDVVIITATFSEPMADSPVVQISGSGVTDISYSNMTKVSTTSYTYSWTVGSGDGTQVFDFATGIDLEGNVITSIPSSGDSVTVDNTAPTALISWGEITTVSPGDVVSVEFDFSEAMADSPLPQISGSGVETIALANMVRLEGDRYYKYTWTVGNNLGEQIFSVATGTDLAGNITQETLTAGASIFIKTPPTASLVYSVGGNVVDEVDENDVLTITATFDYEIKDSPLMQISGSGVETIPTSNMTKVSSTVYTYTYTVGSGVGVQKFFLETGEGLYDDVVTSTPSSGVDVIYKSILNYTYEDFDLNNPDAVKINIIYLTNDINLNTLPEDSNGVEWGMAQVGELLTESNAAFNELYDSTNWPGFELGRITKAYNTSYYNTNNPHAVLSDISTHSVAQQNHLNIVVLTVNRDLDNGGTIIAGTTVQNSSTRGANGATLVLSSTDEGMVPIHEMGHVVGLPHWSGNGWPAPHGELPLYDGSVMGWTSITHSGNNSNYMGSWPSESTESFIDSDGFDSVVSLYLTGGTQTFNSPDFGDIGSEVFRSWLITNEYILPSASATGYAGHDTSLSVASDWVSEGVSEFSSLSTQAFPKIVTSQNENNNYAAVSFLNGTGSELSYSYRNNNSVWGPVTTIQGVDGDFHSSEMAMNSDGDVIIITETWVEGAIKVFSYDVADASWTNSSVISGSGTSELRNSRAKVSINAAGDAVAVWLRNDNNVSQIIFKERVAGSWSGATVLSVDNSKNELPSIAYNDNGDVIVSWQQWNVNSFKYEVVGKFRNGATNDWSSLESYGNSNATAGFSQVALDDSGNALVYWRQAGPSIVRTGLPTNPLSGFLNVRYRNSDGTLETIVQLSDTEEDAFNGATFHNENRVVFLEDGTAAATWWINDGTNPSVIYSSAMPTKNVWTTPVALSNSSHNATMSKIAPGNGGDYSVIWQRPDGLNTRIQTRTYHASTSNWSAISTLSDSNYDAMWGSIASDGDNQLSAMWVRNDGTKHIPEVKRFSLNPFITKTTITTNNAAVSVSFNEAVYNVIGAAGALEANDFTLSITGGTAQLASTTPTSISSNVNTYTLGVSFTGIPDGTEILTVVPSDSGVIFDSGDNAASTSQNNNSVALNEKITHTATLAYTVGGNIVSSVSEADIVTITATFNQVMADSPIVQISGSGVNSISAINMTKVTSTSYTYSWTVGAGAGVQTFAMATGTNLEETVITPTPSSGATIIVVNNIVPTAALTYTITKSISPQNAESSVSAAKQGDVVTITALFSEAMADFPGIQISGSGLDLFYPINMTKVSSTEYTFDWRVNVTWDGNNFASGIQNFTLGTGTDLGGNVITATPTSGESITIDNSRPSVGLVYTIDGTSVSTVQEGNQVLITATFNEDISDQGIKINGYGSTTIPFSDMTKVSTTSYTYLWTVGAGNGNTDFGLGYGTDIVGNEITNDFMTGRSILVDNSSPTGYIYYPVSSVESGDVILVYAQFSESISENPVMQISGSGANTVATTDMIRTSASTYEFSWTVGSTPGTQSFLFSNGTDYAGNIITATPTSTPPILGSGPSISVDNTLPVITLISGNVTIGAGTVYTDAGATASDINDGDITSSIIVTGVVDYNTVGTYTLSYNVTDANNGAATQVTRTVIVTSVDSIIPVITLVGDASISLELGTAYTDAGATATDNTDGTITGSITTVNPVNVNTEGTYTITYNVSDAAGNAATQVTRTVIITAAVDSTIPVITLAGDTSISLELGTTYSDAGATATDNIDGNITGNITTVNPVNVNTEGTYTITYNVSDAAGNNATQVTRTVIITPDVTIPIIIVVGGDENISLELGTDYADAGATATDNTDGTITGSITTVNPVNVNILGTYTITYNVSDAAGNAAAQVTRTVIITADVTIPTITIVGNASVSVELGTAYTDAGATATDNTDGTITGSITTVNPVNVNTEGTYTITYNVSDAAGNAATQVTRTVIITADVTIPVITLAGDASISLELGTAYTDAGATASDNADGDITDNITTINPVNINTEGTYTITYNVSDAAGNAATQVTRTVNVMTEITIPVITLVGDTSVSLLLGSTYVDAGATATDNTDGDITNNITTVNPVNINALGTYTITYNVSDAAGNAATQVIRTVVVSVNDDYCEISEDFENFPLTGWAIFNSNTVNNNVVQSDSWSNDGDYSLRFSSKDDDSAYDQYLLSPEIASSDVERALSFFYTSSEGTEQFKVGWSTTGNNLDTDFTWSDEIIAIVEGSDGNEFNEYSKNNLPAETKYIAIHYYSNHQNYLYIDRLCLLSVTNSGSYNSGITLIGAENISLGLGTTYIDAGAIAFDEDGVDITANIVTVNPVDENLDGVYTITYNVNDALDNAATEVTRTVTVFTNMWNGSIDNNWDTAANWSTNSVPSSTARVRIPKIGITNFPTASTAVNITALTIESGASLIAASTFSGALTYKRDLPLVNDWHFISSPVLGASLGDVISSTDLATGSGTNVGLSIYNNNTPGWEYYSTTSTGTMGSGVGYSLLVNSGNMSFTGTMPIGPVNTSITTGVDGWNLLGNPYPSYLAMNNSADGTNFIDVNSSNLSSNFVAVYLWDAINSTVKVINHASDSYDMSPGQGFFVNVSTDESSLSFTEAMQSHQATETFYRMVTDVPTIELAAFNGTKVKSTIVKYFENTSSGLDIGYDAGLFTNGDDAFKLSTHLVTDSEDVDFALQALNINEFETSIIPVALTGVAGSEIVFSVETLNLPADIKVFLEDKTTTTFTRLDEANSEYIVALTEVANGIGRFYLHTTSSVLNTNDINSNNISIYKTDSSTIRIVGLPDGKSTFKLFNILGVPVIKTTFIANGVSEIKLPLLPAAVYIVQLENEFGKVIKKIILE